VTNFRDGIANECREVASNALRFPPSGSNERLSSRVLRRAGGHGGVPHGVRVFARRARAAPTGRSHLAPRSDPFPFTAAVRPCFCMGEGAGRSVPLARPPPSGGSAWRHRTEPSSTGAIEFSAEHGASPARVVPTVKPFRPHQQERPRFRRTTPPCWGNAGNGRPTRGRHSHGHRPVAATATAGAAVATVSPARASAPQADPPPRSCGARRPRGPAIRWGRGSRRCPPCGAGRRPVLPTPRCAGNTTSHRLLSPSSFTASLSGLDA
jgi:hypothetical protein